MIVWVIVLLIIDYYRLVEKYELKELTYAELYRKI